MAFAPSVAHKPVAAAVCPVMAATEALATEGGLEARGAIFTRSEVVDFILDLAIPRINCCTKSGFWNRRSVAGTSCCRSFSGC